jgi:hypothetical protein
VKKLSQKVVSHNHFNSVSRPAMAAKPQYGVFYEKNVI